MRHLDLAELVDLAEGVRPELSAPHLQVCEACRQSLAETRAMMSAAAAVKVPEPSPLFWDHLSNRVRDAIAMERAPRRRAWFGVRLWSGPIIPLAVVSAAVLVVASVATLRVRESVVPAVAEKGKFVAASEVDAPQVGTLSLFEDPSLQLVADLSSDFDWEAATEAGFSMRVGGADKAIGQLTEGERQELNRLLKEALSRPGA